MFSLLYAINPGIDITIMYPAPIPPYAQYPGDVLKFCPSVIPIFTLYLFFLIQQQAATGLTGGMVSPLYATTPGTDMTMYQAPTPAYAQTPGDVPEMPLMEPTQNEVRIVTISDFRA